VTGMNTVRPVSLRWPFRVGIAYGSVVRFSQIGYKYNSAIDAVGHIIRDEGFRGLYKGLWPNLLKVRGLRSLLPRHLLIVVLSLGGAIYRDVVCHL
jgi:Mitochondrial carrier protein